MTDANIIYDSKTIALKRAPEGLDPEYVQVNNENISASGIIETVGIYDIIKFSFTGFFSQQICFDLMAWWAWAKQGLAFAFAFDSTLTASTTLDGAADAAQKTVPITATTGITAGDFLFLKKDDDDEQEVIEVDSVSAGVSVDAVDNLKYTYAPGDACRHYNYFPAVKKDPSMKTFKPVVVSHARTVTSDHYYKHTFKFIEDKS